MLQITENPLTSPSFRWVQGFQQIKPKQKLETQRIQHKTRSRTPTECEPQNKNKKQKQKQI
jgi:hypothetical protein